MDNEVPFMSMSSCVWLCRNLSVLAELAVRLRELGE